MLSLHSDLIPEHHLSGPLEAYLLAADPIPKLALEFPCLRYLCITNYAFAHYIPDIIHGAPQLEKLHLVDDDCTFPSDHTSPIHERAPVGSLPRPLKLVTIEGDGQEWLQHTLKACMLRARSLEIRYQLFLKELITIDSAALMRDSFPALETMLKWEGLDKVELVAIREFTDMGYDIHREFSEGSHAEDLHSLIVQAVQGRNVAVHHRVDATLRSMYTAEGLLRRLR